MLHWSTEKLLEIFEYIPELIADRNSPNFPLIRAMYGLILFTLIVYLVVIWGATIKHYAKRATEALLRRN
jgi:hypothetical protein